MELSKDANLELAMLDFKSRSKNSQAAIVHK